MNNIKIGSIIAANRKERGITQEELASHLGISKPAVSKWESGQSYPDILLLPELAAYFNISIDELVGYEPQMEKKEVRRLYRRLANDFALRPFDEVVSECKEYLKKYFSCWELQHQIALLLLNHAALAKDMGKITDLIKDALDIFNRVGKSSEDVNLAKQALQLEAYCYLNLQKPDMAIELLEDMKELMTMPTEALLVKAYQMKGEKDKAAAYLQGYVYLSLVTILGAASDLLLMNADNPEKLKYYYDKLTALCELFDVKNLHPAILIQIYLAAAQVFVMIGDKAAAINSIEKYVDIAKQLGKENFKLKGDQFFDHLESYFEIVDMDSALPRNFDVVMNDIKEVIISNPAFSVLESEERFQKLKKRLG